MILAAGELPAQSPDGACFARPLSEVLDGVEKRFGVRVVCRRFEADTVAVSYASFRVRPYSLEQTLDNLLHPLDLTWRQDASAGSAVGGRIVVQPYEYYRRTPADGEKLLTWLSTQYTDRTSWERRRKTLLAGVREALALGPFVRGLVARPDVRLGEVVRHDGYTTQNYGLETLPGVYVCGTIYAPAGGAARVAGPQMGVASGVARDTNAVVDTGPAGSENCASADRAGVSGRCDLRPLIVSPAGHWPGGRYRPDQQLRMATFARMGAVAVDMDIFGWGESEEQVGREAHTAAYAMQMQVLWSKAVTDWIVASRRDIDTTRMAATGGSGGATHALLLAVVDGRFAVLAPVVHLVSHFDGECPCESGRPVTLAAGGSCMPEILAAAMAPKPVLAVSDGGDWTATYPALEYPFLQRIWGFFGAERQVENAHFANERHDYGPGKRRAVYDFFVRTLGLDGAGADETKVSVLPERALRSFDGAWPAGAVRSRAELERMIEKLR